MSTVATKPETMPYTIKVAGGKDLVVELQSKHFTYDLDGELCFTPEGYRYLDRFDVALTDAPDQPGPGWLITMRDVFDLTPAQMAELLGTDEATYATWEAFRGGVRPPAEAVEKLRQLRRERIKRGVVIE